MRNQSNIFLCNRMMFTAEATNKDFMRRKGPHAALLALAWAGAKQQWLLSEQLLS